MNLVIQCQFLNLVHDSETFHSDGSQKACYPSIQQNSDASPIKSRILSKLPHFIVNMMKEYQQDTLQSGRPQGDILYIQIENNHWLHMIEGSQNTHHVLYWNIFNLTDRKLLHKRKIHLKKRKNSTIPEILTFHAKDESHLAIGSSVGIIYLLTSYGLGGNVHKVKQLTMNDLGKRYSIKFLRWFREMLFVSVCKVGRSSKSNKDALGEESSTSPYEQLLLFDVGLNPLKFYITCNQRAIPNIQRVIDPCVVAQFKCQENPPKFHELGQLKEYLKKRKEHLIANNSPKMKLESEMQPESSPPFSQDKDSLTNYSVIKDIQFSEHDHSFQVHFRSSSPQTLTFRIITGYFQSKHIQPLSSLYFAVTHIKTYKPKKVYGILRNLRDPSEILTCALYLLEYLMTDFSRPSSRNLLRIIFSKYIPMFGSQPQFKNLFRQYLCSVLREGDLVQAYHLCLQFADEHLFRILYHTATEHNYPSISYLALQHLHPSYIHDLEKEKEFISLLNNVHTNSISEALQKYKCSKKLHTLSQEERTQLGAFFETQGNVDRALRFYPENEAMRLSLLKEKLGNPKISI